MKKQNKVEQPLKDLVFRGVFFVVLVYVLVFIYNSGIFNRVLGR